MLQKNVLLLLSGVLPYAWDIGVCHLLTLPFQIEAGSVFDNVDPFFIVMYEVFTNSSIHSALDELFQALL